MDHRKIFLRNSDGNINNMWYVDLHLLDNPVNVFLLFVSKTLKEY